MSIIPSEHIERSILSIRGHRVLMDSDLARIYGVTTKRLNEQVRRNEERFPEDFMFQLTESELENLKSQFATSSSEHGGRRSLPLVFTEYGALMLASVLKTPVAIGASIQVIRAFVQLRKGLSSHQELAKKLDFLERRYDQQFRAVFEAIRHLMNDPISAKRKIGISQDED